MKNNSIQKESNKESQKENQAFKPIPNFTRYKADPTGRIINSGGRLLASHSNGGYRCLKLKADNGDRISVSVHRLVVLTFLGPIPKGMWVNHKDGDKANNSVTNLEVATPSENHLHASRVLKRHYLRGADSPMAKLSTEGRMAILELYAKGWTQHGLSRAFGISQPGIHNLLKTEGALNV